MFGAKEILRWTGESIEFEVTIARYIPSSSIIAIAIFTLLLANLLPSLDSFLPPLFRPLPLPIQYLPQILGPIEHTSRPSTTSCTRRTLSIPLQCTRFTKIMPALRYNRIRVRLLADDTRKWYSLQGRIFFVRILRIRQILRC